MTCSWFWLRSYTDDRLLIQSSVVITRSNISAYCIYHLRNWGRISIRVELIKDTTYLALTGKLWRALCEYIWEADRVNTLSPRRNEQHFADDIFKRIFFNENVWISIKISLKFVPKGPINNIPALVQIMAWHRSGDKPLSEPMMVSLPTHISPQELRQNIGQMLNQ